MAKKQKKRRKQYRGKDSAVPPQVIRVEAPERGKLGNWWHENKPNVIIRTLQVVLFLLGLLLVNWLADVLF